MFIRYLSLLTIVIVMSGKLNEPAIKLIEGKNFAFVATLGKDGSPQVTPVWIDHDGDTVLFNTAVGRAKEKNLKNNPRVALAIVDHNNPYQGAIIRGRVAEITQQDADAHIDKLAKKYIDKDKYPYRQPGEKRVIVKIKPEHVSAWPP